MTADTCQALAVYVWTNAVLLVFAWAVLDCAWRVTRSLALRGWRALR